MIVIFLAYMRVWHAGFIWDDDDHLTQNPCVIGPLGFKDIWTSSSAVYYPLVLTTFRLLHALWGLAPLPYHLFNVAMHAACAVLLWRVLLKLRVRGALIGAALWALHPVMVESVAWITELKNTQSCLFYLLSILCFLDVPSGKMKSAGDWRQYSLALMFFLMAVTSKSSTVMLPVVLVLCAWWQEGVLPARNTVKLAPFFLASALMGAWTIWEQKFHSGALGVDWTQTWQQRIVIVGRELWFYPAKLAWPHPLIFIYPRWKASCSNPWEYLPVAAVAVALFALWRWRNGPGRACFFAAAYFVTSLFPVLDFFNVYFFRYSFVADHFQYLASIGPLALLGTGIASAMDWLGIKKPFSKFAVGAALPLTLGFLSWRQAANYADNETLYTATIENNPACWMARGNLGYILLHKGETGAAVTQFEAALNIAPGMAETHYNLGLAFKQEGNVPGAIVQFEKAVDLQPDYAQAHYDLGLTLQQRGEKDPAIAEYKKALEIMPAMRDAHLNLGNIYGAAGNMKGAIAEFQKVLEIDPDYAKARYDLGLALQRTGQIEQALAQYRKTLQLQPGYPPALQNLAYVLAACPQGSLRNGAQALDLAQQALKATGGNDPAILGTLAAAHAENGQFPEAINVAQRAAALADRQANSALADKLRAQLALYQAHTPLRDNSLAPGEPNP